ncbi:SMR family transporter [Wielerella bovis]|uniref:DMT family transporter n=1 Tax=Wielerella bovis TaxID=2917790 RepID=UPI002018EAE8|nr:SMR family transporter [Wielerella bovis]ULJ60683.1 SMR family transporter [Wielerella bovis]ULJ62874.1 SMR family transporter [Wielerella bovis]
MNHWILLAISIACEIFGTTMLKHSDGFTKLVPTLAAMCAFGVAFYLVSLVFRVLPVGIVYAIWSGVGIVVTALISWAVFGQKPDLAAILGMAMIVSGVVVINLFSKMGH